MKDMYKGPQIVVRAFTKEIRKKEQVFEFVDRRDVVLCIPFTDDKEIIFVEQYRAAVDSDLLEFPAGKVDDDETLEEAMKRELLEEIGYVTTDLEQIGSILGSPHFSNETIHIFKASGEIIQPPTPTSTESFSGVIYTGLSKVESLLASAKLLDSKSIAAIALFNAKNNNSIRG